MREVHAIVNSTMNYIWDDLRMGNPIGHIVEEVKRLGYAEPGEKDPIKIILGEAGPDVTKKKFQSCLIFVFVPKLFSAQKISRLFSRKKWSSRQFQERWIEDLSFLLRKKKISEKKTTTL